MGAVLFCGLTRSTLLNKTGIILKLKGINIRSASEHRTQKTGKLLIWKNEGTNTYRLSIFSLSNRRKKENSVCVIGKKKSKLRARGTILYAMCDVCVCVCVCVCLHFYLRYTPFEKLKNHKNKNEQTLHFHKKEHYRWQILALILINYSLSTHNIFYTLSKFACKYTIFLIADTKNVFFWKNNCMYLISSRKNLLMEWLEFIEYSVCLLRPSELRQPMSSLRGTKHPKSIDWKEIIHCFHLTPPPLSASIPLRVLSPKGERKRNICFFGEGSCASSVKLFFNCLLFVYLFSRLLLSFVLTIPPFKGVRGMSFLLLLIVNSLFNFHPFAPKSPKGDFWNPLNPPQGDFPASSVRALVFRLSTL